MSRDEAAAIDSLRRWLAGDDRALEEWLRDPPSRAPRRAREPAGGAEDDRGLLESPAHPGAVA